MTSIDTWQLLEKSIATLTLNVETQKVFNGAGFQQPIRCPTGERSAMIFFSQNGPENTCRYVTALVVEYLVINQSNEFELIYANVKKRQRKSKGIEFWMG